MSTAINPQEIHDAANGSVPEDQESEVRERLEKAEDELVAKIAERRLRDEDPDAWDDGDFDAFRAELGI